MPLVPDVSVDLTAARGVPDTSPTVGSRFEYLEYARVNHVTAAVVDPGTDALTWNSTHHENDTPVIVRKHRTAHHRTFGANLDDRCRFLLDHFLLEADPRHVQTVNQ